MKKAWARLHQHRLTAGFPLVEIMVVVAIIAVLATIIVVAYQGFGERTRDSQRTTDVAQIKIALDKYYADNSRYPDVCGGTPVCSVVALSTPLAQYIKQLPSDPLTSQNGQNEYRYGVSTDGSGYGIVVNYEDTSPCITGSRIAIAVAGPSGPLPKC